MTNLAETMITHGNVFSLLEKTKFKELFMFLGSFILFLAQLECITRHDILYEILWLGLSRK